ncbi:MAG: alpha/beta hydrolase [Pseudomonadota bacterium]
MSVANVAGVMLAIALLVVVVVFGARWLEPRLLYFPDSSRVAPESIGLIKVRERVLTADDGAKLVTWFAPARGGQTTILYFHGNGGHLAGRSERIASYVGAGHGLLMLAYRGYAGSEGTPSERANVADALMAYRVLREDGVAPDDIIVYGESLGSGVAVQLSSQVPVGGVILDAPYTSIVDVGASAYPFLPVRLLMRDRYESYRYVSKITAPVLIIHGALDRIVPVEMGRKLFEMVQSPKKLLIYPEAGHLFHSQFGSLDAVKAWIGKVRSPSQTREPSSPDDERPVRKAE